MAKRLAYRAAASRLPGITNVFLRVRGDVGLLNRARATALLYDVADTLGYRVLGRLSHAFKPQGVTAVLLLSESHVALHTWPEHHAAVIELVTCKSFTARDRSRLLAVLKRRLPGASFRVILNA